MFEYSKNIERSNLFSLTTVPEIMEKYKINYGLKSVTIDQIRYHADLEGRLTDEILCSSPSERAQITSRAYSILYSELSWLTDTGGSPDAERWRRLLSPGSTVYEIGSGAGHLARYLNANGIKCIRTDISSERNSTNQSGDEKKVTDGVNLSRFVDQKYQYLISDQVVEHLHPDDIILHFSEARSILEEGGSYVFRAPNALCGPKDLSLVFGLNKAIFMHLHEFTWGDVSFIVKECKFKKAKAIFVVPGTNIAIPSSTYFHYLIMVEKIIGLNKKLGKFSKIFYFPSQVWVKLCV